MPNLEAAYSVKSRPRNWGGQVELAIRIQVVVLLSQWDVGKTGHGPPLLCVLHVCVLESSRVVFVRHAR